MDIEMQPSRVLLDTMRGRYDIAIVGDGSSTGGDRGPVGSAGLVVKPPLVMEVLSAANYGSNIESEIASYTECLTKIVDYPHEFGLDSDRVDKDRVGDNKYCLLIVTDNEYVYEGANSLCSVDKFHGYWNTYFELADLFSTTVIRADRNSFPELLHADRRSREARVHFTEICGGVASEDNN